MLGSMARIWVVSIAAFALVANLAVASFVSHERTVYFWDSSVYWRLAQIATQGVERLLHIDRPSPGDQPAPARTHQAQQADQSPGGASGQPSNPASFQRDLWLVLQSIWYNDYNLIPILPLLPWTIVFGASRLSFVLAVPDLYAIPAVVLLCLFCSRLGKIVGPADPVWRIWVPLVMVAGFPLFWAPLLRGMVDVGILAFNIAVLLLYFGRPPPELGWRALVATGLLVSLSVLFRRWNAYWVVSFLAVIGIEGLIAPFASGERTKAGFFRHLRPPLVAGGSALLILAVLGGPFAIKAATTHYGDIYDAYKFHDSFVEGLWLSGRMIGGLWILVFALALAVLVRTRETRRLALLLTGQSAIIVVLFLRTQSFGIHHYYLFQAGGLIMSSLAALHILARVAAPRARAAIAAASLAVAAVLDLAVFIPAAAPLQAWLQPLLPRETYYPLVRDDVAELNRLYAKLDEILEAAGPEAKFYVASATSELNDTHFRATSLAPPFRFKSSDRLLPLQYVDKRDGFPRRLLDADFVVLGSPTGPVGGNDESSQILIEPARLIRDSRGLGRAFEPLPEVYHLDNGSSARIFRRVRPVTQAEVQALSDDLRRRYPDRPFVFDPDYH
jgi:hypothetical protein